MLAAEQAREDARWQAALLAHQHAGLELDSELAADKHRQLKESLEEVLGKVDANVKQLRQHRAELKENDDDFRLRKEMGQGKTETLLQAEREELENKGEALQQEMRMINKQRRAISQTETEALAELRAIQQRLAELAHEVTAAGAAVEAAQKEVARIEMLESGVRQAEAALIDGENQVVVWETAGRDAKADAEAAAVERKDCVERVRAAQRALWDVKEELRVMDRAAKVRAPPYVQRIA